MSRCTLKTGVTGEIDLDKLFDQIDKGLIGKDIILNPDSGANTDEADLAMIGQQELDDAAENNSTTSTSSTTSSTTPTTTSSTTTPTTTTEAKYVHHTYFLFWSVY